MKLGELVGAEVDCVGPFAKGFWQRQRLQFWKMVLFLAQAKIEKLKGELEGYQVRGTRLYVDRMKILDLYDGGKKL